LKELFLNHLSKAPWFLDREKLSDLVSENLISPSQVELPKSIFAQAQSMVQACFSLRENINYRKYYSTEIGNRGLIDPGNKSICMSYDFHLDSDGQLKLIEINTNASFLALGFEMYKARGLKAPVENFTLDSLRDNIETEMRLNGQSVGPGLKTAIIDEKPEQQRLFAEFLLYQALFKNWGWGCEIKDFQSVADDVSFIYNRHTDFYLSHESSKHLRQQFLSQKCCFSPNPFEYLLLADKQRMIDWNNDELWEKASWPLELKPQVRQHLPLARELTAESAAEIWNARKKYFIKPLRAFGAKQSYRGESVSRKVFEGLIGNGFIAQQFVPAPELMIETPDGKQAFKYDLRFYAYQDQVQMAVARIYQGQVTNLRTSHGGFAPVLFV
jgi:hypothetical protein